MEGNYPTRRVKKHPVPSTTSGESNFSWGLVSGLGGWLVVVLRLFGHATLASWVTLLAQSERVLLGFFVLFGVVVFLAGESKNFVVVVAVVLLLLLLLLFCV